VISGEHARGAELDGTGWADEGSLRCTRKRGEVVLGDPLGPLPSWAMLLAAFDMVHWGFGGLFFSRVVED